MTGVSHSNSSSLGRPPEVVALGGVGQVLGPSPLPSSRPRPTGMAEPLGPRPEAVGQARPELNRGAARLPRPRPAAWGRARPLEEEGAVPEPPAKDPCVDSPAREAWLRPEPPEATVVTMVRAFFHFYTHFKRSKVSKGNPLMLN